MPDNRQDPFGLFYTWWRGDSLPELAPIVDMSIEHASGDRVTGAGVDLDPDEIRERIDQGHDLYIARVGADVAGWGWSATSTAEIGELGIDIVLPTANRYLWDFVTLPEWRGQGIYPHMLQSMLDHEKDVERFWVGHDFSNVASGRGILKAGFQLVGELYPEDNGFVLFPIDDPERTRIAASILSVSTKD
jgi:GNAT superfamily N-acetyltransferase